MRSSFAALTLAAAMGCNNSSPTRPPALPPCDTCEASVRMSMGGSGGGGGGGGGGGFDASVGSDAAAGGDAALRFEVRPGDGGVALTGNLRVTQALPITETTSYVAASGWRMEVFGNDLGETTTTDPAGRFAFTNASYITVNGTGPLLGVRMIPPRTGALGSFVLLPPLTSVELTAIDIDTFQTALSPAMATVLNGRGHLVIQVQNESAPRGPARDTLVSVVNDPFAQTYYDGPSVGQLVVSATGTGAYGFAVVPNLATPVSPGYSVAQVRLTRNGRSIDYAAPVFSDTVTWVALSPL
ncbi:MAG: hypothetical protein R3A48_16695 [Polyangiales bacterium]